MEITCETGGGNRCAEIDFTDAILPGALAGKIGVTVYSDNFFNNAFCQGNQLNGMFHELLHSVYGPHKPGFNRTNDRTYACAALCFNKTTPPPVTRCQCAECLGVDPCDPRCKGYATAADCDVTCDTSISIDNLACPTTACTCGPRLSGIQHKGEVEGTVSGPVGTLLRLNLPSFLGGQLSCPGWTPTPCPPPVNDLQCCERTDGIPSLVDHVLRLVPAVSGALRLRQLPEPAQHRRASELVHERERLGGGHQGDALPLRAARTRIE